MTHSLDRLTRIALAGAVGGLINATLCYLRWPVPVEDTSAKFHWHVLPAGALHGAVLAVSAVRAAAAARRLGPGVRWVVCLPAGWLAGYLSWIPLALSAFGEGLPRALIWPLEDGASRRIALWSPFFFFGSVAALLCLWLSYAHRGRSATAHVLAAAAAAAAGSLWWWAVWKPWYFCLLHGAVWGGLLGMALARSASAAHVEKAVEA
jgi:hypothetical protein